MKRISLHILMIVCAILMASCQKEFDGTFIAEIQNYQGDNDKVYINSANYACWHNGDQVVINGTSYTVVTSSPTATITTPKFDNGIDIKAAYPCFGASTERLKIDATQNYEIKAGKQVVKAPMVAHTTVGQGNILRFYNAAALMKVVVTNNRSEEIKISKITLSDYRGNPLSGEISYDQPIGSAPTVTTNNNNLTGPTITLQIKNSLHNSVITIPANGGTSTFYLYVAPNVSRQYRLNVISGSGKSITQKIAKKSITLQSNQIATMKINIGGNGNSNSNGFSGGTGTSNDPYIISTTEDFKNFHDHVGDYANNKYFRQINDIEIPSDLTRMNSFKGHYDGGNHIIKFTGNYGLFQTVEGAKLKNMVLDVNITASNNYSGGMVHQMAGGEIKNCKVKGVISYSGTNGSIGGLCGEMSKTVTIEDCVNEANITTSVGKTVGGICGEIKSVNCTINRCVNLGTLTGKTVGGCVGYMLKTGDNINIKIANFANHGQITSSSSGHGGGIIGYASNSYLSIYNSYSYATMKGNACGLIGTISNLPNSSGNYFGDCVVNNVYAGGSIPTNGKWILGGGHEHKCSIENAYSPASSFDANGYNNVVQYTSMDDLHSKIRGNGIVSGSPSSWEAWEKRDNIVKLHFEN